MLPFVPRGDEGVGPVPPGISSQRRALPLLRRLIPADEPFGTSGWDSCCVGHITDTGRHTC